MRRTRVWGGVRFAAALVAFVIACTVAVQMSASAPSLSSVVITRTLPGFVAAPRGSTNGEVAPLDAAQPGLGLSSTLLQQGIADGDLTSYVRTWQDPANGDGIDVIATRFTDLGLIPQFVDGVIGTQNGTTFHLTGTEPAIGFSTLGTIDGVGLGAYEVMFVEGDTVFVTTLVTRSGQGAFDVIRVAQEQAQSVAGASGASWWDCSRYAIRLFALVLVVGIPVFAMLRRLTRWQRQRQRRRPSHVAVPRPARPHRSRASHTKAPPPVAVPRRRPHDPGWVYLERNLNVQCYWDGQGWTERREWDTADRCWVTAQLAPREHSTV